MFSKTSSAVSEQSTWTQRSSLVALVFPLSTCSFLYIPRPKVLNLQQKYKPKKPAPHLQKLMHESETIPLLWKKSVILPSSIQAIHKKSTFTNYILKGILRKTATLNLVTPWSLYFSNNLSIRIMFVLSGGTNPLH